MDIDFRQISGNIQGLYDSLLDCSFRGVIFSVIDSRHEIGRRVERFLFPGRDATAFQDLGAHDGPIRITGLVSGDDYVHKAQLLHTAFRTQGAGTLVHPWLGELVVMLDKPATISFTHQELRIARFEASFVVAGEFKAPPVDTLQGLLDAADELKAQARAWLRQLLAPLLLPLAVFSYAQRFVSGVGSYWSILTRGGLAIDILGSAAAPAIADLSGRPANAADADATTAALAAVPAAIAAAAIPTPPSAVGPGGSIATPPTADPRDAATLLLAAAGLLDGFATDAAPGPGLALGTRALILAETVRAASDIIYTSQPDAIAWRDRIAAAIDAAITLAATAARTAPADAGAIWRGLVALRGAWLADMSAQIGRLPPVLIISLPRITSAWLIAQHHVGDAPGRVVDAYRDLVTRNRVAHPAMVPAGAVELLA